MSNYRNVFKEGDKVILDPRDSCRDLYYPKALGKIALIDKIENDGQCSILISDSGEYYYQSTFLEDLSPYGEPYRYLAMKNNL